MAEPAPDPLLEQIKRQYAEIFSILCQGSQDLTADIYSELGEALDLLHLPPTLGEYVAQLHAAGVTVDLARGAITEDQYVRANTAHFENLPEDTQRLADTVLPCVVRLCTWRAATASTARCV